MLDSQQRRPITLFYTNWSFEEILYKDIFNRAQHELGIRVIYTVTDTNHLPAGWMGTTGRITPQLIKSSVPDYRRCMFYISGPKGMVDSFKDSLDQIHIPKSQIKMDYFSGLA